MTVTQEFDSGDSCDIAIIGMSGAFPGAKDLATFWRQLQGGVESISFFDEQELEPSSFVPHSPHNPHLVKAGGVLKDIDQFDADFFNISAREATWMDPQHRLFLEHAWAALEHAGYNVDTYEGAIALYAGASMSTYLFAILPALSSTADVYQALIANDKDFVATRVSYKLNLRGESISVQTACSTSLVAVHLACQSLLSGQSTMALAGGVSIHVPERTGYVYQEGIVLSPDGHCRAFDAQAQGTVVGNGVGLVVLKLLSDALADGDYVYAVIKGSAINNDGRFKVGYTAPSVEGQAEVIGKAQAIAGVEPETISYIEAHGTGTPIGDPIEIEALTQVFREQTERRQFCALGSLKTNVGHLDTAAGVAGLIKTALALHHCQIPPSLHFTTPNPKIDFASSPFYVNTTLKDWSRGATPRRAGVSSFGIGGTNVHMILEEAPARSPSPSRRPWQMLTLSARTRSALEAMTEQLAEHVERHPALLLEDIAYTRNIGRKTHKHRRIVIAEDRARLLIALRERRSPHVVGGAQLPEPPAVAFMFPGQGSQAINMARTLYATEPIFREHLDACAAILQRQLSYDIRDLLYPTAEQADAAAQQLAQIAWTQPALFAVEYALAKLWQSWGIRPAAMIGYSLGECVAACLAGVLSLEDGLALAVMRGQLMSRLAPGALVSIRLSEAEAQEFVTDTVTVAIVGSKTSCVLAGPPSEIAHLEERLAARAISFRHLEAEHAYHSPAIEPIMDAFTEFVAALTLNPPSIPFVSNLTGTWITAEQATDPGYWSQQMRATVRFSAGLDTVAADHQVLLEVGPGRALSSLARLHLGQATATQIVPSLSQLQDDLPEYAALLSALGQLWLAGLAIDWSAVYSHEQRSRVPLPSYPFERQRYWVELPQRSQSTASNPLAAAPALTEVQARLPQSSPASAPGASSLDIEQSLTDLWGTILTTGEPPSPLDAAANPLVRPAAAPAEASERHVVQRATLPEEYVAPRNEVERTLVEFWEAVLGVAQIGIHDNFFQLGGDSLLATQIFSRLKQAFDVDISLREMLLNQTVAQLSQTIQDKIQPEQPDLDMRFYCKFDVRLGDDVMTVQMTEDDYHTQGVPDEAENFCLL